MYSTMINAAAPIIGGINWPPVDADASVAPANSGLNFAFFIIGIVNDPDATVFATELPEIIRLTATPCTLRHDVQGGAGHIRLAVEDLPNKPEPGSAKLQNTVASTWFSAGLRVYDIADPYRPEEIAAFGFEWDGDVLYQSTRREAYREAMARLTTLGRTFRCSCTRKELAAILTPAGLDAYGTRAQWLRYLEQGMAFSTNPKDSSSTYSPVSQSVFVVIPGGVTPSSSSSVQSPRPAPTPAGGQAPSPPERRKSKQTPATLPQK